jgi:hypothetical protein
MDKRFIAFNTAVLAIGLAVTVAAGILADPAPAFAQGEECGVVSCELYDEVPCLCCLQSGSGGCEYIGNGQCGAEVCPPPI